MKSPEKKGDNQKEPPEELVEFLGRLWKELPTGILVPTDYTNQ